MVGLDSTVECLACSPLAARLPGRRRRKSVAHLRNRVGVFKRSIPDNIGAALVDRGRLAEGVAQIDQAEQEYVRLKTHGGARGEHELIEASALGKAGRGADALRLLVDVLRRKGETGAKVFEAEFQRLLGDLLLAGHNTDTAEVDRAFRTAIEVARQQGAKSSELRATTSLARLLAKQGKRDEARAMLAEIYGWFTEGFDTADLKDAKALLDELST